MTDRYSMRSRLAQRYQDLGQPKVMDDRAVKAMNDLDPGGGLASRAALARDILHAAAGAHEEAIPLFDPATGHAVIAVASAHGHTESLTLAPGKDGGTRVSGVLGTATIAADATHAQAARVIYRAAGIRPPRAVRAHLRKPATMADPPRPARRGLVAKPRPKVTRDFAETALHGHDGARAEQLLASAQARGARVLGQIARQAVAEFLRNGGKGKRLFSDQQRDRLGQALRDTMATAELLGRSRIRLRAEQAEANAGKRSFSDQPTDLRRFDERGSLAPMTPARAVEYFRSLVPALGVTDVERWADTLERKAFTLAVDADGVLLGKVKDAIRQRIETGQSIRQGPKEIARFLDDAGVAPENPAYPEMVFRTNMMDAYNTGAQRELAEVSDVFPVWRYANPDDSRSRRDHAEKNGRYYSSKRSFSEVRGTEASDVINCRCTPIPIDKWEWAELQSNGAVAE